MFGNKDHWFTHVITVIAVVGLVLLSDLPWYWLLVVAMVISGVVEFAIREIPANMKSYDPEQYRLWDAGFGQDSEVTTDSELTMTDDGDPKIEHVTASSTQEGLETLRNRYARGELTEEQFERKVDHLLETETPEDAENWRKGERDILRD